MAAGSLALVGFAAAMLLGVGLFGGGLAVLLRRRVALRERAATSAQAILIALLVFATAAVAIAPVHGGLEIASVPGAATILFAIAFLLWLRRKPWAAIVLSWALAVLALPARERECLGPRASTDVLGAGYRSLEHRGWRHDGLRAVARWAMSDCQSCDAGLRLPLSRLRSTPTAGTTARVRYVPA